MNGWTEAVSKTQNRKFYFHVATGRRQWDAPDTEIENNKEAIRNFYETSSEFEKEPNLLTLLKSSIFYEFTYDLNNDWINSSNTFRVLDLGCGKNANDLKLWEELKCTDYVGVDASLSVKMSQPNVKFVMGDYEGENVWAKLCAQKFDVVSCMLTMQYAFSDKYCAKTLFANIFKVLSLHGRVLMIVPDAEQLKHKQIFKSEIKEQLLYGDKYKRGTLPEWWIWDKTIEELILPYNDLEMLPSINLTKFASWIGYFMPKLNTLRTFEFQLHHSEAMKNTLHEIPSSEDWKTLSLYKLIVIRKRKTCCGFQYKVDYNKI